MRGKKTLALLEKLESEAQRRRTLEATAEAMSKRFLENGSHKTERLLELYGVLEKLGQLNTRLATSSTTTSWYAGMYVQGGMAGIRTGSRRTPWTAKYLVQFGKRRVEVEQFTAVGITRNASIGIHRDAHNHKAAQNHVFPLTEFEGGGIWLEDDSAPDATRVWKEVAPAKWKPGAIHSLHKEQKFSFHPRLWHEVQPWGGDRVVMILYTPRYGPLYPGDKEYLETQGFQFVAEDHGLRSNAEIQGENNHDPGPRSNSEIQGENNHDPGPSLCSTTDVVGVLRMLLACVEETVPKVTPVEHELCLLRPVSESLEQKASNILQQVWEGQEQLVEDLEDQGERLRALLEEEETLLEECRRAGRDVLEEVGQLRDVVDGMLEEIAVKLKASTRSTTTKCLQAAMVTGEPDYEKFTPCRLLKYDQWWKHGCLR